MSNVSSIHDIKKYVSGETKALEGQVLVVARGNTKSNTESICVSVPAITDEAVVDATLELLPHVQNFISGVQAKMLRQKSNSGATTVTTDQFSLAGVLEYLNNEATSSRLTKEMITEYMNAEEQKAVLQAAFAEALRYGDTLTSEQITKLGHMHKGFTDVVTELSGTRTSWTDDKQSKAKKYLELLEDSDMKERLLGRIDGMKDKESETDILALL